MGADTLESAALMKNSLHPKQTCVFYSTGRATSWKPLSNCCCLGIFSGRGRHATSACRPILVQEPRPQRPPLRPCIHTSTWLIISWHQLRIAPTRKEETSSTRQPQMVACWGSWKCLQACWCRCSTPLPWCICGAGVHLTVGLRWSRRRGTGTERPGRRWQHQQSVKLGGCRPVSTHRQG